MPEAVPLPSGAPAQPGARPPAGWQVIGPGLGGLVGLYLLTVTVGETGEALSIALHLNGPMALMVPGVYLVVGVVGAPIGILLGKAAPNAVAITGAVLILIGAALAAFAPGYGLLMIGRVLSGLAAGALAATAVLLARRTGNRPVFVIGLVLAFCALVTGPVAGTTLATLGTWRWSFLIAVPAAIAALIAAVVVAIVVLATGAARR